jgi:hypothetical protein
MAVVIQSVRQDSLALPHDRATAADNSRRWGAPIWLADQPLADRAARDWQLQPLLLVAMLSAFKPE